MTNKQQSQRPKVRKRATPREPTHAWLENQCSILRREIDAVEDDSQTYERIRQIGRRWVRLKAAWAAHGLNIDECTRNKLAVSRQWMDKHEQLLKRWPEFLVAKRWADQLPWEPDRRASVKKALEMMDAKKRFDLLANATSRAFCPKKNQHCAMNGTAETGNLNADRVEFLHGDALKVLDSIPSNSIDTCVTSPPYFDGFRNHSGTSELDRETNPDTYVETLVEILVEVLRVLKPGGTIWLIIGNTYATTGTRWRKETTKPNRNVLMSDQRRTSASEDGTKPATDGVHRENLLLVPARVALALQELGFLLRSEIIWEKATVQPESVTDHPTRSHESVYLFVKNQAYFDDADGVREPLAEPIAAPGRSTKSGTVRNERPRDFESPWGNPDGRNARTVWRIGPKPYGGKHPAPFPVEVPERCLRATLPPGGVVLDPFAGSGTSAIAALKLGASQVILIDTNPMYLAEARERIAIMNPPDHARHDAAPIKPDEMTTLFRGDCRPILASLPDDCIDLSIVDPPYWLRTPERETASDFHRRNNGRKLRTPSAWDQFHSVDDYLEVAEGWLKEVMRVLHPKASLFIFVNQHNIGLINYSLQRLNIQFVNHIIWHKVSSEPNYTGRRLQCRYEAVIWCIKEAGYRFNYKAVKAKAYPDKAAGTQMNDVWLMPTVRAGESVGHPAQKPIALYERILDMCGVRGGTLLDPMAGSGTAGIAAARWGMRSVLIERENDYIEMIMQRWADLATRPQPSSNDNGLDEQPVAEGNPSESQ